MKFYGSYYHKHKRYMARRTEQDKNHKNATSMVYIHIYGSTMRLYKYADLELLERTLPAGADKRATITLGLATPQAPPDGKAV